MHARDFSEQFYEQSQKTEIFRAAQPPPPDAGSRRLRASFSEVLAYRTAPLLVPRCAIMREADSKPQHALDCVRSGWMDTDTSRGGGGGEKKVGFFFQKNFISPVAGQVVDVGAC